MLGVAVREYPTVVFNESDFFGGRPAVGGITPTSLRINIIIRCWEFVIGYSPGRLDLHHAQMNIEYRTPNLERRSVVTQNLEP
jgi:hypothetical protein